MKPDGDYMRNRLAIVIDRLERAQKLIHEASRKRSLNPLVWYQMALELLPLIHEALDAAKEAEQIRYESSPKRAAALKRERRKRERQHETHD